ncbi:MAG: hypothetical protein ACI9IV_002488 [Paracoccaceae bacterium]|jgi:uncharacterized protein (DUF2267 family)
MSAQGLEVIDNSVHVTHEWINGLADTLGWASNRSTLRILLVTLHRIRDHLMPEEVAQLSAQLPLLIRGMYYEGWMPADCPIRERSTADFIAFFDAQMVGNQDYRGPEDVTCVMTFLNGRLGTEAIGDIRRSVPPAIRDIWPAP